ncbi:MAG: Ppx/GppA family phosphatase [Sphingomonadales bacterium]|nr:Ppx/GppA family phosphatase [Sphingomonadales bacterium]
MVTQEQKYSSLEGASEDYITDSHKAAGCDAVSADDASSKTEPFKADNTAVNKSSQKPAKKSANRNRTKNGYNKSRQNRKKVFAALDLGTNNCRLLVATPLANSFRVVDAFSRIVGLGEGLDTHGVISDVSMERAIASLHICAQKLKRRQVTHLRAVATEACRKADNRGLFVDRVREETGIALDIISAEAEAKLAVEGCQQLFKPELKKAIVFDIGGGSTEISAVSVAADGSLSMDMWTSLPIGVVRLAENISTSIAEGDYKEIVAGIEAEIKPFVQALMQKDQDWKTAFLNDEIQLVGSSGTVTTLAALQLGLESYNRNIVDGSWLDRAVLQQVAQNTALISYEERSAIPSIGADRAKLLIPGCAILDAVLGQFTFGEICIADRGIREGVLRGLMGLNVKPI